MKEIILKLFDAHVQCAAKYNKWGTSSEETATFVLTGISVIISIPTFIILIPDEIGFSNILLIPILGIVFIWYKLWKSVESKYSKRLFAAYSNKYFKLFYWGSILFAFLWMTIFNLLLLRIVS